MAVQKELTKVEKIISEHDQINLMAFIRISQRVTFDWITIYFPHLFTGKLDYRHNKYSHVLWTGFTIELINFLDLKQELKEIKIVPTEECFYDVTGLKIDLSVVSDPYNYYKMPHWSPVEIVSNKEPTTEDDLIWNHYQNRFHHLSTKELIEQFKNQNLYLFNDRLAEISNL
ncbi:MAG: hypothetical protein ACFE9L_09020 [Candidatus Hodarchaeota archaeon]